MRALVRSRNILVGHSCMSTMVLSEVMSVPTWGRALATTTGRPAKATARATNSSAQKPEKVPRSTYNIFVKESGPGLLAGRHTSSIGERGRILSEAWKQTSADERARLAEKLEASKRAAAPRTPRSAWHIFMHEAGPGIFAQQPDNTSLQDGTRAIGQAWKSLPDAEKQKYYDKFNDATGKH